MKILADFQICIGVPLNVMNVATVLEEKMVLFIASAKIPEREGGISPFSFYGQLPNY